MIKVINFFIPFLLEMLFGKDNDKTGPPPFQKYKRYFAYGIMVLSFSINYVVVSRLYNVSLLYMALKRQNIILEAKADTADANVVRADQLEKSLEYCMSNSYRSNVKPGKI